MGSLTAAVVSLLLAAAQAPVTEATVYGDRARVVRTAEVRLRGEQAVEFPPLGSDAEPGSVRVEADGAEVRRVALVPVSSDELDVTAARRLLVELEELDRRWRQADLERDALIEALRQLGALLPAAAPDGPMGEPPRLDPTGWQASLRFTQEREQLLQGRLRNQTRLLEQVEEERGALLRQARLLGTAPRTGGWKVIATLQGSGVAKVQLSYVTAGAAWEPRYELQLDTAKSEVTVSLYGQVAQQTGDDWNEIGLTLSTAAPLSAMSFPRLATWRVGEQERFIPTPQPLVRVLRPPPPVVAPGGRLVALEARRVRAELQARLAGSAEQPPVEVALPGDAAAPKPAEGGAAKSSDGVHVSSDFIKNIAIANPGSQGARSFESLAIVSPAAGVDLHGVSVAPNTHLSNNYVIDGLSVNDPGFGLQGIGMPMGPFSGGYSGGGGGGPVGETVHFGGLRPPAGFVRKAPPSSPAARAGGYDLAFKGLRRESLGSGQGVRRVALLTERWPVKLERRLFPALAPEAYLTAELKSPSKQVLPGGEATLFVGDDPAGRAELSVVAPGEELTLPLGVDRAVRGLRTVQLVQREQGVFLKDEVGEYVVTTEVANPYAAPIELRVHDQVPLEGSDKVEVKLLETEPRAQVEEKTGALEWRLTVPPGTKAQVRFRYSLQRPKHWRLTQEQDRAQPRS